jgi:hypothetical protein
LRMATKARTTSAPTRSSTRRQRPRASADPTDGRRGRSYHRPFAAPALPSVSEPPRARPARTRPGRG